MSNNIYLLLCTKKNKKIPAWDLKGRIELMERKERENKERLLKLENQNQNLNSAVQEKEMVVVQNQKETEDLSNKVSQYSEEIRCLKRQIQTSEDDYKDQLRTKNRLIEDLEYSKSSADRRMKSLGK